MKVRILYRDGREFTWEGGGPSSSDAYARALRTPAAAPEGMLSAPLT